MNVVELLQLVDIGKWRSLVAHPLWERRVAGSNPVFPTIATVRLQYWGRTVLSLNPGRITRS